MKGKKNRVPHFSLAGFPRVRHEDVVGVKVVRLRTERENAVVTVSIAGNNRVNFGDRLLV